MKAMATNPRLYNSTPMYPGHEQPVQNHHGFDASVPVGSQRYPQQQYAAKNSGPSPGLGHQPQHIPHQQIPNYQPAQHIPNYQPQPQLQQQGHIPPQSVYYAANNTHSYSQVIPNLQDPSAPNMAQYAPTMHHALSPGGLGPTWGNPPVYSYPPAPLSIQQPPHTSYHSGMVAGAPAVGIGNHTQIHNAALQSYGQGYPIGQGPTAGQMPPAAQTKRKRKRKLKDPRKPKKSASPFIHFGKVSRHLAKPQGNVKRARGETMKALARIWAGMSAEEKKPFVDACEEDKQRYLREMKEYEQKYGNGETHTTSQQDSKRALPSIPPMQTNQYGAVLPPHGEPVGTAVDFGLNLDPQHTIHLSPTPTMNTINPPMSSQHAIPVNPSSHHAMSSMNPTTQPHSIPVHSNDHIAINPPPSSHNTR
mmetsp:Transcript_18681/g.33431  ORF Transcript_18681/g.33431 Transcript_18681/m.33431 type:complete len:419 (-) Transcript_18681:518-1774(-)|eukprot:CAMPEP_0197524556 /NCGR_PEP_ID=MMETSP1318-20131121/9195_1 /TAXON_ID=552666 /ORGANISM="Partenskyella glossopodia, Strain RCC365" /LENGTH=418 /DNA_ID=CAMNT_0043077531 /DNA_START=111 /DNA_END=1367 /DNA_ORIENTATION=+